MSVIIREVSGKPDMRKFVDFQFRLYKHSDYWIPPLRKDEMNYLIPDKNPAYEFCKAVYWLAYKDNRIAGRIGAIINPLYNDKTGQKMARFTLPEFIDDKEVSQALFQTVEQWAKKQGMEGIHGPLGFTNLDHQGLLIEGFDHLPSIASIYNLPYYQKHVESMGYEKEIDWIEFRITIPAELPEKAGIIADKIRERYGLTVLNFSRPDELKPYAKKVFHIINEAFAGLFSVIPFSEKMMDFYIRKYFHILNPRFVKIIVNKEQETEGFIISLPSLSKAMQKAKGRLFPFGIFHVLRALKHPDEIDLLLTGIKPKLQGMGFSSLLINELYKTCREYNIRYVETTGMFETNHIAIQHWKNFEHIQHKRKRCYKKNLIN